MSESTKSIRSIWKGTESGLHNLLRVPVLREEEARSSYCFEIAEIWYKTGSLEVGFCHTDGCNIEEVVQEALFVFGRGNENSDDPRLFFFRKLGVGGKGRIESYGSMSIKSVDHYFPLGLGYFSP